MKEGVRMPEAPLIVRKSFSLPYHGGEIWCEQLDALSDYSELVEQKFLEELRIIARPSSPGRIALQLYGTLVTERLAALFISEFTKLGPKVQMLAIIGAHRQAKQLLQSALKQNQARFTTQFFDDFELAKSWLIP